MSGEEIAAEVHAALQEAAQATGDGTYTATLTRRALEDVEGTPQGPQKPWEVVPTGGSSTPSSVAAADPVYHIVTVLDQGTRILYSRDDSGALIPRSARVVTVSGTGARPLMGDTIAFDDGEYEIANISELSPGGVSLLFDVELGRRVGPGFSDSAEPFDPFAPDESDVSDESELVPVDLITDWDASPDDWSGLGTVESGWVMNLGDRLTYVGNFADHTDGPLTFVLDIRESSGEEQTELRVDFRYSGEIVDVYISPTINMLPDTIIYQGPYQYGLLDLGDGTFRMFFVLDLTTEDTDDLSIQINRQSVATGMDFSDPRLIEGALVASQVLEL